MKTMKDLASDAIDVQDASNLSGVVHSFSQAMTDLRRLNPELGTEELNTHYISVMWASKIASLTRWDDHWGQFYEAYDWCKLQVRD